MALTSLSSTSTDLTDENCLKHPEYKTELYCVQHNLVICVYCFFEEHASCETNKLSILSEHVEACIKKLQNADSDAECTKTNINKNIERERKNQQSCKQKLNRFSIQISRKFQDLQRDMEQNLSALQSKTLPLAMESCQQAKDKIGKLMKSIEYCREMKHPSRLFVELESFAKEIKLIKADISKARLNNICKTYVFKPSEKLYTFPADEFRFGTFEEKTVFCDTKKVRVKAFL